MSTQFCILNPATNLIDVVEGVAVYAPNQNAGLPLVLNDNGALDPSFYTTADSFSAYAATSLGMGVLVNLYFDAAGISGAGIYARLATAASASSLPAHGFISSSVTAGTLTIVNTKGMAAVPVDLVLYPSDIGSAIYLSPSAPGQVTKVAPTAPNLIQPLGYVYSLVGSVVEFPFTPNPIVQSDTSVAQVNSDWNAVTGVAQVLNKPTLGTAAAQDTSAFDAAGSAATVAGNLATETTRATTAEALLVPKTTTVNGHALSANVVVSASDLTTGTLPASAEPAHTGDVTNTAGSLAMTVKGINGTTLSSLASGLIYSTTTTGVPSIATSAQVQAVIGSGVYDASGAATTAQTNAEAAFTGDVTKGAGSFATTVTKTGGVAFAASATTDTTNATNISSGTLGASRLPLATTSAFGGVKPDGVSITISGGVISAVSGGGGTVTSFSSGNLSPLFTTTVSTATSTPALSFTLSNVSQNSVLAGPISGGAGAASYQTAPTISAANMTSFPTLNQNTTGTAAGLSSTLVVVSGGTGATSLSGIVVGNGTSAFTTVSAPTGVIVGTTDTQTLTNKTIDGVTPATMAFVDPTSSIQTQLNGKQATLTNPVTGTGSGATVGHIAVMGNTSGTAITDGGAIPTALPPNGSASGDLSGSYPSPTVTKVNGTSFAGLATGILKNTTTTGIPSIAIASDFPTLNQNTTGSSATLTTPRTINGVAFDGSANITVAAAASTLTGTTLATGITTASGLTTVAGGTFGTAAFTASSAYDAAGAAVAAQTAATAAFTGDVTKGAGSFATTVTKVNGTSFAGLATGIVKNTTTTGVPSIAIASDFPTLNQNTTGSSATLTTPRNINGVAFDGSSNITVTAAAGTLTGSTLASGVSVPNAQVTGLVASATTDTTNASNISSGTLSASRLATSGVTAASYTQASITVDAAGRVTAASTGNTLVLGVRTVTANTTVLSSDYTIIVNSSSSVTVTFPTSGIPTGLVVTVKSINTGDIVCGGTIDGYPNPSLGSPTNTALTAQWSGSAWYFIGSYHDLFA